MGLRAGCTKLPKFPSLSMVKPTEFPLFEIPFWLVPRPHSCRRRSVEIGELVAVKLTLLRSVMLGPLRLVVRLSNRPGPARRRSGCAGDGASRC